MVGVYAEIVQEIAAAGAIGVFIGVVCVFLWQILGGGGDRD